jgi:hypothetical protein
MLRSAGFRIDANPEEEVFVCHAAEPSAASGAVYPVRIRSDYKGHAAA